MTCLDQTSSGDLDLSSHNLKVVQDKDTALAFKLANRFKLFLGEWFLDTRIGVPYFDVVFVKNPDLTAVAQMFKSIILKTPGAVEVLQMNMDFLSSSRNLICSFKIRSDSGAIITGGPGLPFIVEFNSKGVST